MECMRAPLAMETQKQGGWWIHLPTLIGMPFFVFQKMWPISTNLTSSSLICASCDKLVGTEWLLVACLVYFLYSSVWKWLPIPWPQPASWGESCEILAWPILCLLEAASCQRGREELITNSFEISSLELWLPSHWADTRFLVNWYS